jgi:cellulose synthase/poly-beta-1,6-N-acetylglucosamine synthase-like glycosyltransferase
MALKTVRGLRSRLAARWSGLTAPRAVVRSVARPEPAQVDVARPVLGVPVLSVVVVVYNDQDRLTACVDSLLSQTLQELEVILVDEGSTDHSLTMIAAYADQDPRVRVLTMWA